MFWVLLAFIFVLAVAGALYYLSVNAGIEAEIEHDKVPFSICEKHGGVPDKYLVDLPVEMMGLDQKTVKMCPFCFEDKMKVATGNNKK